MKNLGQICMHSDISNFIIDLVNKPYYFYPSLISKEIYVAEISNSDNLSNLFEPIIFNSESLVNFLHPFKLKLSNFKK